MLIAFEWFRIVFSLFHHRRIKGWHFHWKAWLNIFDIKRKQTDGFGTNIWRNVIKCKHAAEEDLKGNIDRDHHLECLFPIKADAFETFLSGCLWYCKRPNYCDFGDSQVRRILIERDREKHRFRSISEYQTILTEAWPGQLLNEPVKLGVAGQEKGNSRHGEEILMDNWDKRCFWLKFDANRDWTPVMVIYDISPTMDISSVLLICSPN